MRLCHKPNSSPDLHTDCDLPKGQALELTIETVCVSRFSPHFVLPSEASLRNSLGYIRYRFSELTFFPIPVLLA